MKIVFTIAAKNYLASAFTLRESVLASNKDVEFYIVLADEDTETIIEQKSDYNILKASDIGIEKYTEMAFKYDVVEFNTSVKPFFIRYAFETLGAEKVMYLDPDIYVYKPLDAIWDELDSSSIVLTPHAVDGNNRIKVDELDKTFLKYGIYNLGFVGVSNCEEGRKIADWWCERLADFCYMDDVYFVDQKWMNYVPALFAKALVDRSKAYNIAWWNFTERKLIEDKDLLVEDGDEKKDVVFIHFSNYKPGMKLDYYEDRGIIVENEQKAILNRLYEQYQNKLLENGFKYYSKLTYQYNYFENGCKIERINRRIFRKEKDITVFNKNYFSVSTGSFFEALKQNKLISDICLNDELKEQKAVNNSIVRTGKSKKTIFVEKCLRMMKNRMGVRKYQRVIAAFENKCSIDEQEFLIKRG